MSYKKWVYKYKYLQAEIDEIKEKMQEYTTRFNQDFITNQPPPQETFNKIPPSDPPIEKEKILESKPEKKGKDLYKELAKEFHPDKGGTEEDFKLLNSLYQDEDVLGMYLKAEELGISVEMSNEETLEETFEKTCSILESKIKHYKTTAAWRWGTVSKEQREHLSKAIEQQANVKRRQK